MLINLIVATCATSTASTASTASQGIGYQGQMPWHLKADLQNFSKLTKGKGNNAVVMGKQTWLSLPFAGFPDRDNLVLSTTSTSFSVYIKNKRIIKNFSSYASVMAHIASHKPAYDEVWIIGGAAVYQTFLAAGVINNCYITAIDKAFECDTFFPALEGSAWKEIERRQEYDETYACNVDYIVYHNTAVP